jgi:hypothetical protein
MRRRERGRDWRLHSLTPTKRAQPQRQRQPAYRLPSPSLGPPLLSASWSPPLFCGIAEALVLD